MSRENGRREIDDENDHRIAGRVDQLVGAARANQNRVPRQKLVDRSSQHASSLSRNDVNQAVAGVDVASDLEVGPVGVTFDVDSMRGKGNGVMGCSACHGGAPSHDYSLAAAIAEPKLPKMQIARCRFRHGGHPLVW